MLVRGGCLGRLFRLISNRRRLQKPKERRGPGGIALDVLCPKRKRYPKAEAKIAKIPTQETLGSQIQ